MKRILLQFISAALFLFSSVTSFTNPYIVDDNRIDALFSEAEEITPVHPVTRSVLSVSPFHFRNVSSTAFGKPLAVNGGEERVTAGILGIFLGFLGVHRFYLGHTSAGITYLAFTLIGPVAGAIVFFATCGIGVPLYMPLFMSPLITWVIGIVDGAHYLSVDDKEFETLYKNDKSLIQW